jgi:SulP family sulfate permease
MPSMAQDKIKIHNRQTEPGFAGTVVPDLLSGLVVSVISVAYCISFGALIFSGPLADGLSIGLNAILLGAGIAGLAVASGSSLPRAVGGPDTPPVAILSALAASVAAAAPAGVPADRMAFTVISAISLATLLTGLFLFLLGALRLGAIARFIPFSVVAGFLCASGCLLISGSYRVATHQVMSWDALVETVTALPPASHGFPFAVGFAVAVFVIRIRYRQSYVLPACFCLGIGIVYGYLALRGISIPDARQSGWFFDAPFGSSLFVPVLHPDSVYDALPALMDSFGEVLAVAVVTTMAVILNTSGLEAVWKRNANLEREFRITGLSNMIAGMAGGVAGNISLNRSMLNAECGGAGRLSAAIPGVVCLGILATGGNVLTTIPAPVLSGLLLFLGGSILVNCLGWTSPRRDWPELLLILFITGVILTFGYLEGLLAGLIGASLLFAYSYSRINIIKHEFTRQERGSNVDRSPEQTRFLSEQGHRIHVVNLHGYLFFATSNRLVEDIRQRFLSSKGARIDYLVVGFRLVSGVDISTALSFVKLRNACEECGVSLLLCGLSPAVSKVLHESRQTIIDGDVVRVFALLDDALEWAEEDLLRQAGSELTQGTRFEAWLREQTGYDDAPAAILPYLKRLEFRRGDQVVAQGGISDSVDLVESGRVRVMLKRPGSPPITLRSMLGHTVLGEMGFYRGADRTASVVAEQDTVIYRLKRAEFERMKRDNPQAGAAFDQLIIRTLADRLSFANAEVAAGEL